MRLVTIGVVLMVLVSCTGLRPYRCEYPSSPALQHANCLATSQPKISEKIMQSCHPAIETTDEYFLGFVEFDDVGSYWDKAQRDYVLSALEEKLRSKPHIIVVFIHGWNHNAEQCDTNVVCFQRVLSFLDEVEKVRAERLGREPWPIAGIYIGWRGAAFKQDFGPSIIYNWSSFWSRKRAAHEVGSAGGVTEVLAELERISKSGTNCEGASRLITVGHSFGAAVTYDAVSQILAARAAQGKNDTRFGDSVVLVNPAFEATQFELLRDRLMNESMTEEVNLPPMVIFSSAGDRPNQVLFPAGRFLSNFLQRHRPSRVQPWRSIDKKGIEQGTRSRTAIGEYEPWRTHVLEPMEGGGRGRNNTKTGQGECTCPYPTPSLLAFQEEFGSEELRGGRQLGRTVLRPIKPEHTSATVTITRVDSQIIPNHNAIYSGEFIEALIALVVNDYPIHLECKEENQTP